MAAFKCKMCGGMLQVEDGKSIATCDYCGSEQTVGTRRDETVVNMYNRATNIRMKNDFDKAQEIYEKILDEDDTDAEAHWGVVLCKYGIEYVEDPKTHNRIPTCHRTLVESVTTDVDYLAAMEYGDVFQRKKYEEEARKIAELQNEILSISSKEKPFDVFICYKEKDENGNRTQDSVLANDIYYQLTQAGLRVFYAAITLEDKLGTEYEPYIYAALHSAKVMLVIGTKPEYFEAVWVKNEWSRYLAIMNNDRNRTLIPCFRDMDAYDLPEEFAHLQAQDMSKIGFINDIVRGIRKLTASIQSEQPASDEKSTAMQSNAGTATAPLLKRVFIFLEDGDWKSADEYCEKVLDIDPECAEAYLGKLMAAMKAQRTENLLCSVIIDDNNNFRKILKYGDEELVNKITHIAEQNKTENRYVSAMCRMNEANSVSECEALCNEFKTLGNYKDSEELAQKCFEKWQQLKERDSVIRPQILKNSVKAARIPVVYSGSRLHVVQSDGTVVALVAAGFNTHGEYGECNVSDWRNIIAISTRDRHTVGLRADGTVVATGCNDDGQCNVSGWRDIIAISAGYSHTIGLRADGTVVATGENRNGECNVSGWRDIVAISTLSEHTIGLRADGTVVATGNNKYGQCNVSGWRDIIAISAGYSHTIGLRADGTVVATGDTWNGEYVSGWRDIIAISAGSRYTVGLRADGTVVATGFRECWSDWRDIVVVHIDGSAIWGLDSKGKLVAAYAGTFGFGTEQWRWEEERINFMTSSINSRNSLKNIMPISNAPTFEEDLKEKGIAIKAVEEERKVMEDEKIRRRSNGVCQYCGGTFKGVFTKKCSVCGKPKDY